jgi:hypothetical protein
LSIEAAYLEEQARGNLRDLGFETRDTRSLPENGPPRHLPSSSRLEAISGAPNADAAGSPVEIAVVLRV